MPILHLIQDEPLKACAHNPLGMSMLADQLHDVSRVEFDHCPGPGFLRRNGANSSFDARHHHERGLF
jgi:hypothetical protein